jgi:hypothetical protein
MSLNGTTITQAGELYHYRSYIETILNYGSDAAVSHLTNAFWYLYDSDMMSCDPTAVDASNKEFIRRWDRIKRTKKCNFTDEYIATYAMSLHT